MEMAWDNERKWVETGVGMLWAGGLNFDPLPGVTVSAARAQTIEDEAFEVMRVAAQIGG